MSVVRDVVAGYATVVAVVTLVLVRHPAWVESLFTKPTAEVVPWRDREGGGERRGEDRQADHRAQDGR